MTFDTKTCWKRYDESKNFQNEIEHIIEVELENEIILEKNYDECVIKFEKMFVSIF